MNFYISDLHLGHYNIINLCNRPFFSVEEMDETIIKNWNSMVYDNDDVYILGDFSYRAQDPERYMTALKGNKHLIIGNHDYKWLHKYPELTKHFASVQEYLRITDGNIPVILFHYPILEWDGYYHNTIHLYGHVHNSRSETISILSGRKNCYNVGADILDFTPRNLEDVIRYNRKFITEFEKKSSLEECEEMEIE